MNETEIDADLAAKREQLALAEALRIADEIPTSWLVAAELEIPRSEELAALLAAEPDQAAAIREWAASVDLAAHARAVEQAVGYHLRACPPAKQTDPLRMPTAPRRWWLAAVPLAAVAGLLLVMNVREPRQSPGAHPGLDAGAVVPLEGVVEATSPSRGPQDPPGPLEVPAGEWFGLRCHADGHVLVRVEATAQAPTETQDRTAWLRTTPPSEADFHDSPLHVHAELPRGRWAVTCVMQARDTRQLVALTPPAAVSVR